MWKVGDENDNKIQVPEMRLLIHDEGTRRKRIYKTPLN